MTAHIPETYGSIGPWQRYVARERAARDMYLEVTSRASHEYLTGPWPDRAAYEVVERQAWATYYAAGRDAWRTYTRELTPPPPPPPSAALQSPAAAAFEQEQAANRYWAPQPSFTETNGGAE